MHDAAGFALRKYDLPAIPSLPRRSPAEGMIAQAVVGINGVTTGQYGSIAVDRSAVDPASPVLTDIGNDAYGALRAFLAAATARQLPRPGEVAVRRPRHPRRRAHARRNRAGRGVRRRRPRRAVTPRRGHSTRWRRLSPSRRRLVWLDEPWFGQLMHPGFPIAPEPAIDLLSSAMAAVQPVATVGVHCCAESVDVASLLAAGPDILAIPVHEQLATVAGYLDRFLLRRRPHRLGSGADRRADPDRPTIDRGGG